MVSALLRRGCRLLPCSALFVLAALLLASCAETPPGSSAGALPHDSTARARAVIDSARAAAGAHRLDSTRVSFRFRGEQFWARHPGPGGEGFRYARRFRDSLGRHTRDAFTSAGALTRRVEGGPATQPDSATRRSAGAAINSVIYFALLPAPLGDDAVRPHYAGADTLGGVPYHRVAVRFRRAGGGRDWQDRFLYWFDQRDFSMDYLAYAYGLGPGDDYGTRFREAFNTRRRGGIRFADYRNFTAPADSLPPDRLARYSRLYEADSLDFVSTVALYDIRVRPLPLQGEAGARATSPSASR